MLELPENLCKIRQCLWLMHPITMPTRLRPGSTLPDWITLYFVAALY